MVARSLHRLRPHLHISTSVSIEWAWAGARVALVALAATGAFLFLRDTAGFVPLLWMLGAVLVYNGGVAFLLRRGRLREAALSGFALDNLVLLVGWWVIASMGMDGEPLPSTDLYLGLFPMGIIGMVRLGPVLGSAYVGAWGAWIAWAAWHFQGSGSYAVQQLPIRLFAWAIISALVLWLVSQRNEARRAGRAINGRYEALFEMMTDAVFIASTDGEVVDINNAARKLLHVSPDSFRGTRMESFVKGEDRSRFREAFQRAVNGEAVTQDVTLVTLEGGDVPVEIRASTADLQERWVWLGVARDLTDRKEMEEQFLRNERLRVMGQMASGIAHDVNNALTPIIGYSELLAKSKRHRDNEEYLVKTLGVIHTSAQDAALVVSRLREFYRPRTEHEPVAPVDVNRIARQVIDLAELRRKEREYEVGNAIRVLPDLDPEGPTVLGHEDELRQALMNLLFNSMDALGKGGTITVSTRRMRDGAQVMVKDDGTGMSPEALARCTEPFFTTKGKQGTGLGLPMVHGCVRRHGGKMDVQSKLGEGTAVTLHLPLHKEEPEQAAVGQAPDHEHVLVVDDEPAVREVLTQHALALGHSVEAAPNGEEALELVRAGNIGVVLTDMSMPGMNGMELGAEVKKVQPGTPVIVVTGFQDLIAAAGESLWESVDLVLNKPVALDSLEEAINTVSKSRAPA